MCRKFSNSISWLGAKNQSDFGSQGPHQTPVRLAHWFRHCTQNDQHKWWQEEKKDLALKASPDDNDEDIHNEDLTLLPGKFKRFKRREGMLRILHKRINLLNVMANCLLVKNKPHKSKRIKKMCTSWDEMEGSESEIDSNEEEAMLCFMAFEENKHEYDESEVNDQTIPLMIYFVHSKNLTRIFEGFVKRTTIKKWMYITLSEKWRVWQMKIMVGKEL